MRDPMLIEVPERIETARLVLRVPQRGDGAAVNAAVAETMAELAPWLPWAGSMPTPDESEMHCRRLQARFILREDLAMLMFERRAGGGDGAPVGVGAEGRLVGNAVEGRLICPSMQDRLVDASLEGGLVGAAMEGRLVGGLGLHRIDWLLGRFEIGYWRRAGFEGRGLVTEGVIAIARMAFDVLGARRVEIRMDDRNERSWKLAERAGFTLEAVLRFDAATLQGEPCSTRVYARVRGAEEPMALPRPA